MINPAQPIGPMPEPGAYDPDAIQDSIARIANLPARVRELVTEASPSQLSGTYRPGSWTATQIIHHLADSHLNSLCRFKLALTENHPTIRPYDQDAWVLLGDTGPQQLATTLQLLEGLHGRWVALLRSLAPEQWHRTFHHPENDQDFVLHHLVHVYAWHGDHHLAQANHSITTSR